MLKAVSFAGFALLLFSCRTQFPIAYNDNKAKDPNYKCYIKPKKGAIISGDNIEMKNENKLFKPTLFTINGTTFKAKDIEAYQNENGLFLNIDGGLTKALTGPGIYTFRKESINQVMDGYGHWSTQHNVSYYIKKAGQDDYKLVNIKSSKTLMEWTEDNSEANEQATLSYKYGKKVRLNSLVSWGGIIGGFALIALDPKNSNNNTSNKVSAMSYLGLGLVGGGMINLPINLFVRRAKAGRAYASAINLYNDAPVKIKKK